MSELKNQVRKICEARMEQVQISSREADLIQHIRGLQTTLELLKYYTPNDVKELIDRNIEVSKDVVNITLGIRS